METTELSYIVQGLNDVYGLTLDYQQQMLYWCDLSNNRIERSTVTGSNREVIVSSLQDPWGITFHRGMLYWTDITLDRIFSYSVTSSPATVIQVTSSLGTNPYDIRVVSDERQPLGEQISSRRTYTNYGFTSH